MASHTGTQSFARIAEVISIAVIYFLLARCGQVLAIPPGNVTPIWLPSGFILAVVLMRGYGVWPGIFFGAFAGNIWAYLEPGPFLTMIPAFLAGIANGLGDALCAMVGAWLVQSSTGSTAPFHRGSDMVRFAVYAALIGGLISAIFGVAGLFLTGFVQEVEVERVFYTWWIGDAVGVLVLTPIFLTFKQLVNVETYRQRVFELVCFLGTLLILSLMAFEVVGLTDFHLPIFVLLPVLIWSVFRFAQEITFVAILVTSLVAVLATINGFGEFYDQTLNQGLMELQVFLAIMSASTFILSGVVTEREESRTELTRYRDRLEQLVVERTKELTAANEQLSVEIDEKQEATKLAKASEASFKTLCDMSPNAIVVHRAGRIVFVNQTCMRIFGTTDPSVMLGKPILDFVHPDYRETVIERVGNLVGVAPFLEEKFLRADGSPIDVEVSGARVEYQGEPAIQAVIKDITERKQLEAQLRQSQKMEAIGILTGGIAHEFNNLLSPILGYSEIILADKNLGDSVRDGVNVIQSAGQRAKELVQQMLAYSRQSMSQRGAVVLGGLIEDTLVLIKNTIPPNIDVTKSIEPNVPPILGMTNEIQQVLMNLCINAVQAMPKGGELLLQLKHLPKHEFKNVEGKVQQGDYVCLRVKDTGCGMDEAVIEKIFDPFFTTKEVGEGSGLGLSVVFGVVTQNMGHIEVESEPDKGTAFSVYLPVAEDIAAALPEERQKAVGGTEHILIIDDEPMITNLAKKMLQRQGYQVTTFTDCAEAVEFFAQNPAGVDLVITDYGMPKMSGKITAEKIRTIKSDVPIVLFTGYGDLVAKEDIHTLGMDDLIMKPFDSESLSVVIRGLLDR